jgi:HEAT repeats
MKKSLFTAFVFSWVLALSGALLTAETRAQTVPLDPPPAAPVRPETLRRIERALFVVEGEAPDSFFLSLGIEGREALVGIAIDRARALGLRRRAVLLLHHYPDARVRSVLGLVASDTTDDAVLSRYALRTLRVCFGASAFEAIRAGLSDPRPMVREGAALALVEADRAAAIPVLTEHLEHEGEAFVREAIERALEAR